MIKVLSVGLCLMDRYLDKKIQYPGGNELNAAVFAARLGYESSFIGVFGNDEPSAYIRSILDKYHIDCSMSTKRDGQTGYADVRLENGNRVFIGHNNGGVTGQFPIEITDSLKTYIASHQLAMTSLYGRLRPEQVIRLCGCSIPVAFDFSDNAPPELVEMLCPHLSFSFFSASGDSEANIKKLLKKTVDSGCPIAIASAGEKGAWLYDGHKYYRREADPIQAVDTMGAGDAFITAFLTHYLQAKLTLSHEDAITSALDAAAGFAAEVCKCDGSFGLGIEYNVERR